MAHSFRRAVRENVPLLIGLAGPTGSGKTLSALKIARGLSGGKPFAVIDTESGRAKHYAPTSGQEGGFIFDHMDLPPPHSPEAYSGAIAAADAAGYPVVVVDSASHEWAGEGGCIDMHDKELEEIVERKRVFAEQKGWAFDEWKTREASNIGAWVSAKTQHKRMVSKLLQLRAHVILCMRAEDKIEIAKDANGKTEIRPMETLTGYSGMIPICEKRLPFELTLSLVFSNKNPGVPIPIKVEADHRPLVPLDRPITDEVGIALAKWAAGADFAALLRAAESLPALADVWAGIPKAEQPKFKAIKDACKDAINQKAAAAVGSAA